jgi:beta-lactamase regulating signal transducer with metallopeptidase domain
MISHFAPAFALQLLNSLLLGLALSVLVSALLRSPVWRRATARFAVLYSALLAIAATFFFHLPSSGSANSMAAYLPTITVPAGWAVYLLYAWFALATIGILKIGVGLARLQVLRRRCLPLDLPEITAVENRQLSRRDALVCVSREVRVPTAVGFIRPMVIIPAWALEELSREELKTAVLHELAHIERWDDWTNLSQKVIRALLFFHPAVWWIDARLAIEREMSCDDTVLAKTTSPERYAQCLVSLAEKSFLRRQMALAQAAVGRVKHTALRIARILDGQPRETSSAWKPALAALTVFSALGFAGLAHVPQLISFQAPSRTPAPVSIAEAAPYPLPAVVPASLHESATRVSAAHKSRIVPSPAAVRTATSTPRTSPREQIAARPAPRPLHIPSVINAAGKGPASPEYPPQYMYVVFQTRDYDAAGTLRITTSVWKVRLTTTVSAEIAPAPQST